MAYLTLSGPARSIGNMRNFAYVAVHPGSKEHGRRGALPDLG